MRQRARRAKIEVAAPAAAAATVTAEIEIRRFAHTDIRDRTINRESARLARLT